MDDDNDGVVKVSSDDDEDAGQAGLTRIPLFCIGCDMHHIVVTFQRWHLPAYICLVWILFCISTGCGARAA